MSQSNWKEFWEAKAAPDVSDVEFDRGRCPRQGRLDTLSNQELLAFIEPKAGDVVFDAGCGTGVNLLLLHAKVERIVAMDFAQSAVERCRRRLSSLGVNNVELLQGDIAQAPLPADSVDKILCMSVLQYLDDDQVRSCLRKFAQLLRNGGIVILHVKNLSSLYLSTLVLAKRAFRLLGKKVKLEYFRTYGWYVKELRAAGFEVVDYNSFNLLMLEGMPKRLLWWLQELELANRNRFPYRTASARRHGSDLKLRARLNKRQG